MEARALSFPLPFPSPHESMLGTHARLLETWFRSTLHGVRGALHWYGISSSVANICAMIVGIVHTILTLIFELKKFQFSAILISTGNLTQFYQSELSGVSWL